MNSQHVEIYPSFKPGPWKGEDTIHTVTRWRWRLRAGNGRILSQSSESYRDPRDLVHGLELSFPGCRFAYNYSGLGGWWLCPPFLAGEPIPVRVPPGTEDRWKSRRKR